MATINPGITPADRLSFTVFLAIAIHAIIIQELTHFRRALADTRE